MSGVPVLVEMQGLRALVVGGGAVASRKVASLVAAGAHVRVVATEASSSLRELAASGSVEIVLRAYASGDIGDADLVIAATSDRDANTRVAADARAAHRLVSVADKPEEGSFTSMAVHRDGDLVIGVSAGGVPAAAARLRDAIARRFDARHVTAIASLSSLRRAMLGRGERTRWEEASRALIGDDFCSSVESGTFEERVSPWR